MASGSLAGKVAVVTGASRGIGKGIALELAPFGVTCVSLWPGVVRTELLEQSHAEGKVPFAIENGETPRFTGRGVVALAADPERHARTGRVIPVTRLAAEYGFRDVDGRQPGRLPVQMGLQESA